MTIPLSRRHLLAAGGVAMIGATTARQGAKAQPAWPSRPVRLVVGFTAGSATDVTARIFAQRIASPNPPPMATR
jgi:tripartite-type tricarboxylate transporter receptor subunit TctC